MKTYSELLKNQNECINSDIKAAKGPKAIHSKFQNMIFKKKRSFIDQLTSNHSTSRIEEFVLIRYVELLNYIYKVGR